MPDSRSFLPAWICLAPSIPPELKQHKTADARFGWIVSFTDEAFAAKHLSDMGEETEDFTVFTWPLKDYRSMDKKALSPEFECGGHKW